ncbi:MAG: hypothetical protein GF331_19480 [Chitinivibrionales bacterium]|nr:hypothetical protein [Chitinivibrionales bacterium]
MGFGKKTSSGAAMRNSPGALCHSAPYAHAASPLAFLSHPSPAEVLAGAGTARLNRRRGGAGEWMRDCGCG